MASAGSAEMLIVTRSRFHGDFGHVSICHMLTYPKSLSIGDCGTLCMPGHQPEYTAHSLDAPFTGQAARPCHPLVIEPTPGLEVCACHGSKVLGTLGTSFRYTFPPNLLTVQDLSTS